MTTDEQPACIAEFQITCREPRGYFQDDWQAVAYHVVLSYKGREVFSTDYKIGLGHIPREKVVAASRDCDSFHQRHKYGFDERDENLLRLWANKPHVQFTDKLAHAGVAAKIAKRFKIEPKLTDVLHSLLSDGSNYFDHQSFEEWCADFGYNPDSRKAETTYRLCSETGRAIARAIPPAELKTLREFFQNY